MALQATGLSGLRPNTYCLNFPTVMAGRSYDFFYSVLRHATAAQCSLLVTKGIDKFPAPEQKKTVLENLKTIGHKSGIQGTVDVWWIRPGFEITKKFVHEFVHEKNRARFHDSCTIKNIRTIFLIKNEF